MKEKGTNRIDAHVVAPDRALFEGAIGEVITRTASGVMTILPNHQPALLDIQNSPLILKEDGGKEHVFVVVGGFLEFSNNNLTMLMDAGYAVKDRDEANTICSTAM